MVSMSLRFKIGWHQNGKRPMYAASIHISADSDSRLALFRQRLSTLFSARFLEEESIPLATLLPAVNEGMAMDALFGSAEARACAISMTDSNDIMLSEDIVYKI